MRRRRPSPRKAAAGKRTQGLRLERFDVRDWVPVGSRGFFQKGCGEVGELEAHGAPAKSLCLGALGPPADGFCPLAGGCKGQELRLAEGARGSLGNSGEKRMESARESAGRRQMQLPALQVFFA